MYNLSELYKLNWFKSLPSTQRQLLEQSFYLLEEIGYNHREFYDYSFIVMPASKAYEGFVKDFLFLLKLISEKRYKGRRFRVGKALNPALGKSDPDKFEALFDDLIEIFGSEDVPNMMWKTWKQCRNQVFHYFYDEKKAISLYQAKEKLQRILKMIEVIQEFKVIRKMSYRFGH